MQTAAAAVQPNFQIQVPKKEHTGRFFVFFAADMISGEVKANNEMWSPGGLLRPSAITLQYRLGYIRKCEITEMRQQMISDTASNFAPAERRHLTPAYTVQDGQTTTHVGRSADGSHDGLLRIPYYPDMEIERITGARDGLVKMPVATAEEALRAQYVLFPYWDDVIKGAVEIPRKISVLRAFFRDRLAQAKDKFETDVITAAIKSCDDFAAWGRNETTAANAALAVAKAKGWPYAYGSDAEAAFEQLGLQRQDSLVQDQGNQMNTLTDAVAKLVEFNTPRAAPDAFEMDEFRRWKAAQEAAVLLKPVEPEPLKEYVMVNGREAQIVNPNLFGKVRVKYNDGTEEVVTRESLLATAGNVTTDANSGEGQET